MNNKQSNKSGSKKVQECNKISPILVVQDEKEI